MPLPDHTQQKYENPPLLAKTKMLGRKSSEKHKYMPQQNSERKSFDKHRSKSNPNPPKGLGSGGKRSYK